MKNYTYGLKQGEGSFITRAIITFEHKYGLYIIIQSEYGLYNYFGTSADEKELNEFTKSWAIKYDPNDEDWKILAEIFDRPYPKKISSGHYYYDDQWNVKYSPSESELFYMNRDNDIEAYITSKLGEQ